MTTTTDIRGDLIERLGRIDGDLGDIAERLPARGSTQCQEQLLTLHHHLMRTLEDLSALAEETWGWVQSGPEGMRLERVDAKAQENVSRAQRRVTEILYAIRTDDAELAYWVARDVIDHAHSGGDYLMRLCGVAVENTAA